MHRENQNSQEGSGGLGILQWWKNSKSAAWRTSVRNRRCLRSGATFWFSAEEIFDYKRAEEDIMF